MKIKVLCMLLASMVVGAASALANEREGGVESKYEQQVLGSFAKLYSAGIDEKLYIQSDKPYYSGGESIWFKGYLVSAITHKPLNISNYIYVELLSREGDLVSRVKIKRDSTGFSGYIPLDPEIAADDYTLRGYTRRQGVVESEYLFTKNIEVVSPITATKDSDGKVVSMPNRNLAKRHAERLAEVEKPQAIDYDLQFFPEGGQLLPGMAQIVAFKALGRDGLSVEIEGSLYGSQSGLLGSISTSYNGMGLMSLIPTEGEQYYVEVSSVGGVKERFDLPAVDVEGATLKVSKVGDRFYFLPLTTNRELLQGSHIIIHSRGQVVSIIEGDLAGARFVEEGILYDGVSVISLVDSHNRTLSERVIFKRPAALPTMTIEGDRDDYARREMAKFRVKVLDSDGAAARGEFGVAVVDSGSVESNPSSETALSYLLLSSEIRGHVEHPGLYFEGDGGEADRNLDLLMRTQAWRRFDLSEVLAEQGRARNASYEVDTEIDGSVKGFFGNKARRPKVYVFNPATRYLDLFDLDESSAFRLVGLDIPDSTTFIIQARGRSGGKSLTLDIAPQSFPAATQSVVDRESVGGVPLSFVNQSQEKFIYDGGMNTINLEAVTVTKDLASVNDYNSISTQSVRRDELDNMPSLMLRNIIQRYAGMQVSSNGVMYRGGPGYARFILDGMDVEFSDVESITADQIEQIDFFAGADAALFYDSSGGVFTITTRMDFSVPSVLAANIKHVKPLGYQAAATFYQPSYDNPKLKEALPPDYRTTIYWNGRLTTDESGEMEFRFFTADRAGSYTIIIEGVTEDGEICRATSTMSRTRMQ